MTISESRDDDNLSHSISYEMGKRLWVVPSEDSQFEVKKNPASFLLDKVIGLSLRSDNDRRDFQYSYEIDDYNDEDFEYEPLVFFDLPRPGVGEIVIAVQAATISSLKMNVHQEVKIDNVSLDLNSGIAIVGVVREIGPKVNGTKVGDRVATIIKSMMKNARYAKVLEKMVVDVPCGLDSAESAAVAYTYLLGFQSLTHGIVNEEIRYSRSIFRGKTILIIDGASTSGLAIIQLAKSLGAKTVYATGRLYRHDLLKSFGAEPLTEQPKDWMTFVEGKMDIVIDTNLMKTFQHKKAEKALKLSGGKIVYVGYPINIDSLKYGSMDSWKCLFEQLLAQITLVCAGADATYYDLFSHFDNYPEGLKNDLRHVLLMLAEGRIQPRISKYVSSDELAYGLVTIDPGSLAGSIICEPWKRKGPPRENPNGGYTHVVRS